MASSRWHAAHKAAAGRVKRGEVEPAPTRSRPQEAPTPPAEPSPPSPPSEPQETPVDEPQ